MKTFGYLLARELDSKKNFSGIYQKDLTWYDWFGSIISEACLLLCSLEIEDGAVPCEGMYQWEYLPYVRGLWNL